MGSRAFVLFLALVTSSAIFQMASSSCSKCHLPYCRCWDAPYRPGNFSNQATPQIISIAFAYAMNNSTLNQYLPLFRNLVNPNNCPAKATFFAQDLNTDVPSLKRLHELGHEVGLTSADGSIPKDRREWVESLFQSSEKLYDAGVTREKIRGAWAPNLFMGGNDEIQAEEQFGMDYEASCVYSYDKSQQMLWPYTYDNSQGVPKCGMGNTPNISFPGIWQFLVPEMNLGKHICTSLSSCSPYVNTTADAFTLLYNSFQRHYYTGRAPMVLYVDPQWLTRDVQKEGLREFLETVGRFSDTWIVTLAQALEWVKYPVPMYKTVRFLPWECSKGEKIASKRSSRRR